MSNDNSLPSRVQGLHAHLLGYGRVCPADLKAIAARNDWAALAYSEWTRRNMQFLQGLPTSELVAIACGELDLAALAAVVHAELTQG